MALVHCMWLYITLQWIYFTPLDPRLLYHDSTSLYLTLHYSAMALLHSTCLYITLPWLYFTLLDFTLLYIGSTSLYLTLHYSAMALIHSTWLYIILLCLYFTLPGSTLLYFSSTSLYLQYLYDNGKWVNYTLWKHFEVDLEFRPLAQVRNLFKDHLWDGDSLSQLQSSWLRFTQGSHLLIYYCMQTSSKHLRDHEFSFIYWLCVKHLIFFFFLFSCGTLCFCLERNNFV